MAFPSPELALEEPDGLLAAGGDLSPERLLSAYRQGIFPWFNEGDPILWWCPSERAVLQPGQLHTSRSLRKKLRRGDFQVSFDRDFDAVINACAAPRSYQQETWIIASMRAAYNRLHQLGHAHSVEVWQDQQLVGGLYGIAIGRCFFGESMFSRTTDASKAAFNYLACQLFDWGYGFVDCQLPTDHLSSMGVATLERAEFLQLLAKNIDQPGRDDWTFQLNAEYFNQ